MQLLLVQFSLSRSTLFSFCCSNVYRLVNLCLVPFRRDIYYFLVWGSYVVWNLSPYSGAKAIEKVVINCLLNCQFSHPDFCSAYIEGPMSVRTVTNFSRIKALVMVLTVRMTQAHLNTINPHCLAFQRFVIPFMLYLLACIHKGC
jgi:hypothetical protein